MAQHGRTALDDAPLPLLQQLEEMQNETRRVAERLAQARAAGVPPEAVVLVGTGSRDLATDRRIHFSEFGAGKLFRGIDFSRVLPRLIASGSSSLVAGIGQRTCLTSADSSPAPPPPTSALRLLLKKCASPSDGLR